MKRTTLKDIARALGVAPSTVSRALADHPDLSDATKARVRDVAQALRYAPDIRARNLRERHTQLVALVLPEVNTFFVPSLMSGVNAVLQPAGYAVVVLPSGDSMAQEQTLLALCLSLAFDGVLLARSSETRDLVHLDPLDAAGLPIVLLDKILPDTRHSTVSIDDRRASFEATSYLLERGHRHIVGVFSDSRQRIGTERMAGFRDAVSERGLPPGNSPIVEVPDLAAFDARLGHALDAHPDATALFAMSDELLVRTQRHVAERGRRVPEDLSLVALSDGEAPYFFHPPVTHRLHSGAEVGAEAARVLLRAIGQAEPPPAVEVKLQTDLVELGSVRSV